VLEIAMQAAISRRSVALGKKLNELHDYVHHHLEDLTEIGNGQ
jgi:hypothetical protein